MKKMEMLHRRINRDKYILREDGIYESETFINCVHHIIPGFLDEVDRWYDNRMEERYNSSNKRRIYFTKNLK